MRDHVHTATEFVLTYPYDTVAEYEHRVKRHLSEEHGWPAAPIDEAASIHDSLHEESE